jgi:hypothetical protein
VEGEIDQRIDAQRSARKFDSGESRGNGEAPAGPDADPIHLLTLQLAQLGEAAHHLASARVDALRVRLRNTVVWILAGLFCGAVGLGIAVIASAYLIDGLSRGFSILLGNTVWGGRLVGGLLVLGLLVAGTVVPFVCMCRASKRRTIAKYRARREKRKSRLSRGAGCERNGEN